MSTRRTLQDMMRPETPEEQRARLEREAALKRGMTWQERLAMNIGDGRCPREWASRDELLRMYDSDDQ